jgi:predicted dehydrogenase
MPEKVRWGVLGNAMIGRKCVLPAITKSYNGRIAALATRRPAEAEELVHSYTIDNLFDNYDALIDDPEIDAVYVPLPNHLHRPWTIKALESGKHVLCEKPLACNAGEARQMASAAADAGRFLMEAFMYRFHPRTQRIRSMVAEGAIGRLRLIRAAFCFAMDDRLLKSGDNIRLRPESGGGALLDVGCYGVSVIRWLMGAEPSAVQAQAEYHRSDVDLHMVGTLQFGQGGLATVEASFTSALQQTYTVSGTSGSIELPHDAFIPWEKDAVFYVRNRDEEEGQMHAISGTDEYQLMVEHFGDVVLGKSKPAFDLDDSLHNMKVLDALALAARTGKTVSL